MSISSQKGSKKNVNIQIGGSVQNGIFIIGDNNTVVNTDIRPIEWDVIRNTSSKLSEPRLQVVEGRMNSELYIDRLTIKNEILKFLSDDNKKILALVGNSGYGKSAFLWGLAQYFKQCEDIAYLFCDASLHLKENASVITTLLLDLARILGMKPENILPMLNYSLKNDQKLVIIIDAVNEFSKMQDVEYILRDLNTLIANYKWIKLILSCRPHFWKYIYSQKGAIGISDRYFFMDEKSGELYITVGKLDEAETKLFYQKYQSNYKLKPVLFDDLNPLMKKRLSEPLLLWLISEICTGEDVSKRNDLIIDIKAIPEYIKKLEEHRELFESEGDIAFLQNTLPKMFFRDGICNNYIYRSYLTRNSEISNIDQILYRLIRSGVLKEDGAGRLSFSFERFFGYYSGIQIRKIAAQGIMLNCVQDTEIMKGG